MHANHSDEVALLKTSLVRATKQSIRSLSSTIVYFMGTMLFSSILVCLSAAPSLLPALYLALGLFGLPYRIFTFCKRGWQFYLVDFCYAANALVIIFIIASWPLLRLHSGWFSFVYVVAEGPLAAALIAWQCAWVFSNVEHTLSTLIHLLPGLCMFALRHLVKDLYVRPLSATEAVFWLVLCPIAFHCIWQLIYFVLVQVVFRSLILRNKLETSYRGLAMRAKKSDNWLHRFIRRGSASRRITWFGLFQLSFTLVSMVISIASFYSFKLAVLWQAIKFTVPLWYGSHYQTHKVPEVQIRSTVSILALQGYANTSYATMIDSRTGMWKNLTVGPEKKEALGSEATS